MSRVVRRCFLCGKDEYSGKSYEHRRQWIEDELLRLSEIFALEISAYSVMSNHYHIVLHINHQLAKSWSDDEVIERWHHLFKGIVQSQRQVAGETLNEAHQ